MRKVLDFLGMSTPPLEENFAKNPRGKMPACKRCGALVTYESQQLHNQWHTDIAN
ncbi:MAG: hypothetical protein ACRDAX_07755 [Propionibacteriaceae bacterium]